MVRYRRRRQQDQHGKPRRGHPVRGAVSQRAECHHHLASSHCQRLDLGRLRPRCGAAASDGAQPVAVARAEKDVIRAMVDRDVVDSGGTPPVYGLDGFTLHGGSLDYGGAPPPASGESRGGVDPNPSFHKSGILTLHGRALRGCLKRRRWSEA